MKNTMKPFALFVLMAMAHYSFGQSQITGNVITEEGQPLSFANVLLLSPADSSLIKGVVTKENGSYVIENVRTGDYLLAITMIGFADHYTEVFSVENNGTRKNMDAIVLKTNAAQLEEVSVVAKKQLFEQKIDRMVVNVANSITSAGTTALEVLQRSPGVQVSQQSGAISMSGKNGVVIMINGKISRLPTSSIVQMLEGMSSDNVDRIELIHTPPANFDAEGNAGIINIILKKSTEDGVNGSYTTYAGYGMKEKYGGSTNFNVHKNKINLYGDYSYSFNNNPQRFTNYRSVTIGGDVFETDSNSDRDPTHTHTHFAHLGLDYELSEKTVLGILTGWADRYWKMDAINDVTTLKNGVPTELLLVPNNEINHWQHLLGNVNLQHKFTDNETLNLDLDYAYYFFQNPSGYTNQFFDTDQNLLNETRLRVEKTTPMNILVGKADYTKNFGEKMTLEAGLKGAFTRFNNDLRVEDLIQNQWIPNPDFTADFSMEENILAAYSAFTMKVNDKTDLKVGLRYEYTTSNLGTVEEPDIVDRKYGNFFPSVFVSRKINDDNQIQFSYSRRINRPGFLQLAPWFIFLDPTTVTTGNPALQPSITDAVKADYRWKTIQLSLQYSFENEAIANHQPEVDVETNRQINRARNFDNFQVVAATLSFPVQVTEWWEMQNNFTGQWQQINDNRDEHTLRQEQTSWYYNGVQSFRLPKNYSIEVSGYYFAPNLFGGVKTAPIGVLNLGFQKQFGNNNNTLRFSINDVFFTGNWRMTLNQPALNNLRYEGFYRFSERVFRLSYSQNFGSSKVKKARQRTTGSEEERRRVN